MRTPPTLMLTCVLLLPVSFVAGCGTSSSPSSPSTPPSNAATTPVINWSQPANVPAQTALGSAQLNATANVAGAFTYDPAAGTVLQAGDQTLTAKFTPEDATHYSPVTASRRIHIYNPEDAPTLASVQLSGSSTSVQAGKTIQLTAKAVYSDKSTKDVTSEAQWTSTNNSVASVKAGTVSAV